jgi:hypothetical protein
MEIFNLLNYCLIMLSTYYELCLMNCSFLTINFSLLIEKNTPRLNNVVKLS